MLSYSPMSFLQNVECDGLKRREGGGRRYMALVYLAVHVGAVAAFWMEWSKEAVILLVGLLFTRGFCISGGYHRLLAHKAYKTSRFFQFLLALGGCTSLRGGPLWWVALHRHHHAHSDTEDDTFTPEKGFWWSYVGWLVSGRFDTTDYSKVGDLARLPELRWLNRFWLLPPIVLAASIWLLGGWSLFLIGFCCSSALLFHSMAALDSLNHLMGFQRYDTGDNSKNSVALALFNLGEGWHNNHHHYQSSANSGFFWWEVDGTYTLLRLLALFRIVWDLRTPPETVLKKNLKRTSREGPAPILLSSPPSDELLSPQLVHERSETRIG